MKGLKRGFDGSAGGRKQSRDGERRIWGRKQNGNNESEVVTARARSCSLECATAIGEGGYCSIEREGGEAFRSFRRGREGGRYRDAGMHCIVPNRTKYRPPGSGRTRCSPARPSVVRGVNVFWPPVSLSPEFVLELWKLLHNRSERASATDEGVGQTEGFVCRLWQEQASW